MSTSRKITDNLVLITLDLDIWSGQSRLNPEDFRIIQGELPPKDLANLGNKKLVPPKDLRSFNRIKTAARRLLFDHGRGFLGGYAIPKDRQEYVEKRLDGLKAEFDSEVERFLNRYTESVQKWADSHPYYGEAIRQSAPGVEDIRTRFKLDWQTLEIVPADEESDKKLQEKAGGLSSGLFQEIVERAQKFATDNLAGRQEANPTTLKSLNKLREKVAGLAFLDGKFEEIVDLLDHAISQYPASGPLKGESFSQVLAVSLVLGDENRFLQYRNGEITLSSLVSVSSVDESEPGDEPESGDASDAEDSDDEAQEQERPSAPIFAGAAATTSQKSSEAEVDEDKEEEEADLFF